MRLVLGSVSGILGSMVVLLLGLGCEQRASAPAVRTPPPVPSRPPQATPVAVAAKVWQADPALLDQLEPYQDVEGYEIRLPKGFELAALPETPLPGISGAPGRGQRDRTAADPRCS